MDAWVCKYVSPVGSLLLGASLTHVVLCDWIDVEGKARPEIMSRLGRYGVCIKDVDGIPVEAAVLLRDAACQLDEYFQGERQQFTLPLQLLGTSFQQRVWRQLQTIPSGMTMTYSEQAAAIGSPRAVRAVANADRLNALSIIIPCHRVVGSDRSLTGYAGGLKAKRWIIGFENDNTTNGKV